MIQSRRLFSNVVVSGLQVVVVGLSYLLLYPFLLRTLGADLFGLWTLVLATTTASNLANLGLAGSMVKFVAQYQAREDDAYVRLLIQTALLTLAVVLGVVLLAAYPLFGWLLDYLVARKTPDLVDEALLLLPYALTSFWLTALAGVALSSLDGFQRVDRRGVLTMAAALLYLGLGVWLTLTDGLLGLARAQVLQAAFLLVASWITLQRTMPTLPWLPRRWSFGAFREMLGYSVNFQLISLTQMLLMPVTSALLTRFGGVALTGYFELANRIVLQLRALIVTAYQAIVPTIADLHERDPAAVRTLYHTSLTLLLYLVLPTLALLLLVAPYLSEVFVGTGQPDFIRYSRLLVVGWFLNILGAPAYFAYMGTGVLRWNVVSHALMGLGNAGLGVALGLWLGGDGVVLGLTVALLVGGVIPMIAYQREQSIAWGAMADAALGRLAATVGAGSLGAWALHRFLPEVPLWLRGTAVLLAFTAIVGPAAWAHPVRRQVLGWITDVLRPAPAPPAS